MVLDARCMQARVKEVLLILVASLVAVGCEENEYPSFAPLSLDKVCELQARKERPSEDECEKLCANDDVDKCSLRRNVTDEECADPAAKTTVVDGALWCVEVKLGLIDPFEPTIVDGRRPEGFERASRDVADLGSYFAACHELEAASIDAFARLVRELVAFGAPPELVLRARRAQQDEVRHARWTAVLARRHGVAVSNVPPAPLDVRTLFAMALENAVEGVVRETFGAAHALYRAARIPDPRARKVMARIASDECEHAQLSWDVAAFAWHRLGEKERATIAHAMRAELASTFGVVRSDALRTEAGLPDRRATRRIVDGLRQLLADSPFLEAA